MQITSTVHQVGGTIGNTYLIVSADSIAVVDAGLPGNERAILRAVHALGHKEQDVKHILITHTDMDHIGGLAALKAATRARVYASRLEADAIASAKPSRQVANGRRTGMAVMFAFIGKFMPLRASQADEIVQDGQVLPIAGGIRVLDTPGHTPGHISYYLESEGVLFSGDSLLTGRDEVRGSNPPVTWDTARAEASARRQKDLMPRIVCSGHGPVVTDAAGKFRI